MSLLIVKDWIANQDKTLTFYDTQKNTLFANGKTKDIQTEDKQKIKDKKTGQVSYETVMQKNFEHVLNLNNYNLTQSTQISGFQLTRKSVQNNLKGPSSVVVALGRRMKENKKFLQTEEEIEILFGLKEAKQETTQQTTQETTQQTTHST